MEHAAKCAPAYFGRAVHSNPLCRLVNEILSEQQLDRYSAFRRSNLRKPMQVRKLWQRSPGRHCGVGHATTCCSALTSRRGF